MSYLYGEDAHPVLLGPNRRQLLQHLAGTAISVLPLLSLQDAVDAGKRKRRKRRKKRKQQKNPPIAPGPSVRADATCPGPAESGFIFGSQLRIAQSFTAGLTGDIVRADLVLDHFALEDGEYFLRLAPLFDGLPADLALATARVDDRTLPDGESVVPFTFDQPAQVTAGASYALVLTRAGGGEYTWRGRFNNPCPGRSFVATGLTAPFDPSNQTDFLFTTFVRV